ncbi:MAG: hypothetical protein LCH62_15290 [Proteobacteria bacterium]|nr:hypothetical protein [Pseudomonadota bacterium]
MASEYRLIFFDQNELCRALIEYNRQRRTPFPPGNLKKVVIDRHTLNVTIQIDKDAGQSATVAFDPSSVAAALIVYCRERKIPLPAKSAKEMRLVADRLCFLIRIKGTPSEAAIAVEYTGKIVANEVAA